MRLSSSFFLFLFFLSICCLAQDTQWIVTLKPRHRLALANDLPQIQLDHTFVVLDSYPTTEWLAREDIVAIEPVQSVHKSAIQPGSAYWHLDRLDGGEASTPNLDGRYSYTRLGSGVTAFVLDSGVRLTHEQFGGRASFGFDTFGDNFQVTRSANKVRGQD